MDGKVGFSEKEIHYIDEARIIGGTEGNSKRLSDLCHKAYADYAAGAISEMAYNKIYAVCIDYAYPRQILFKSPFEFKLMWPELFSKPTAQQYTVNYTHIFKYVFASSYIPSYSLYAESNASVK